jgi:hypothetical protein
MLITERDQGETMVKRNERAELMAGRVGYLASEALTGRAPGTEGGRLAREYVREAFSDLALEPLGDNGAYDHAIEAIGGANLLGSIPGHGPNADKYLLIGAHYDHLGENFGDIYPGADDNASGVAVLLDVARALTERDDLDRTVIICSFDAEEPPHFYTDNMGSWHWVDRPTVDPRSLDAMVCVDLIGHPLGPRSLPNEIRRSVFVMGAERSGLGPVVDGVSAQSDRLVARRLDAGIVESSSDHYAFERVGIPFLFYTARRDRHYHTPLDTPEKLDYEKMVGLADHLTELICTLADGPAPVYNKDGTDNEANLRTLVEVGRHAGPLHRDGRVMMLIEKLERKLEDGTPITKADRGGLKAAMAAIEDALA